MLNDNSLNLNQFEVFFNSLLIFNIKLSKLLSLKNRLVSAANNTKSVILEVLTISFVKIKNSKEATIDPWGTPHVMGAKLEFISFIETYCLRLVWSSINHCYAFPLIP